MGFGLLMILSSFTVLYLGFPSLSLPSSTDLSFLPNFISTGKNLQYFPSISLIFDSLKNSLESSLICKITSVPLFFFFDSLISNSVFPSHFQYAGLWVFMYDFDLGRACLEFVRWLC